MAVLRETIATSDTVAVATVDLEKIRKLRENYEGEIWRSVIGAAIVSKPPDGSKQRGERLLSQYVTLAVHLAKANNEELYQSASFGLGAYQYGMWDVAEQVSKDVRFAASTTAALSEVMRGLVSFVLAMIVVVYLGAAPFLFIRNDTIDLIRSVLVMNPEIMVGTGFGFLGSIVSLLLRLPEFEVMRGRSRQFLFLTGCTLPVVGGTFAAVISALFASHVVSFSLSGKDAATPDIRLFILIGFLSGFSERFSRGLLTSMENRIAASLARNGGTQGMAARATRTRTTARTTANGGPPSPLPTEARLAQQASTDDGSSSSDPGSRDRPPEAAP